MRGLYGQNEGNESRTQVATFGDRLIENDIAEGREVAALRAVITRKDWTRVKTMTAKLLGEGHSKDRVDSMISRAMAGLRF